jgi:hypothetical protein
MTPRTEQFALLPDAKLIFAKDDDQFVLLSLDESVKCATALCREHYEIIGAVGTQLDGRINGISERGGKCCELVGRAVRLFICQKTQARKPVPPVAWLENLALLEDPRS